jgi:leucyl/phenylalanyl-tRNA--protein transferase
MPVYVLNRELAFPAADDAEPGGLLAVGGDLQPQRLLLAYASGIFPWYEEGLPILWHSPNPRMVLSASLLHVPRSLRQTMRKARYEVRYDTAFEAVIRACGEMERPGQRGTWITSDMIDAYCTLHELGFAHSAEAWREGQLAGGLYGVSLGGAFFGESMFARLPDASKVAFITLVGDLRSWGIGLIDCQVHTEHLARFGAKLWTRKKYLAELEKVLDQPTRRGRWQRRQVVA